MTLSSGAPIAFVTGASRGIGKAIALRLARDGATVAVHYGSNATAADETVAEIAAAGGIAFSLRADLADTASIAPLLETLDAELAKRGQTGLDILVNNAGIGEMLNLEQTGEADFDRVFAVNVKAPFFLARAALPRLRDGGRIITLSSMVSLAAYPSCIAYAMTKASVNSLTRSLAAELGGRGITVNAVAPGATATDFIGALREDGTIMDAIAAGTALGRIGGADDIADVVAFLASPAGRWITGQVIQASGGMHL